MSPHGGAGGLRSWPIARAFVPRWVLMGGILMGQVPGGTDRCLSTAASGWFGKGVSRLGLPG